MLASDDVKALMGGQSLFLPRAEGSRLEGEIVQLLPVHSRRNGQVTRIQVRYVRAVRADSGRGSRVQPR